MYRSKKSLFGLEMWKVKVATILNTQVKYKSDKKPQYSSNRSSFVTLHLCLQTTRNTKFTTGHYTVSAQYKNHSSTTNE